MFAGFKLYNATYNARGAAIMRLWKLRCDNSIQTLPSYSLPPPKYKLYGLLGVGAATQCLWSFRSSKCDDATIHEVPLDEVISQVSKYLADENIPLHGHGFMIAGSYAAAAKAKELGADIANGLTFNDIDVWIRRPQNPDDKPWGRVNLSHERIDPKNFKNIPVNVNLNFVREYCDVKYLVEDFDINAIRVGVQISFQHGDLRSMPIKPEWHVCPSFHSFLKDCRVEIIYMDNGIGNILRVLHKSSQMKLPYNLPPDDELTEILHLAVMNPGRMEKWEKLSKEARVKMTSIVGLEKIPDGGGRKKAWSFLCKRHFVDNPELNENYRKLVIQQAENSADLRPIPGSSWSHIDIMQRYLTMIKSDDLFKTRLAMSGSLLEHLHLDGGSLIIIKSERSCKPLLG